MRIAIAGIEHETNTYCRGLTRAHDFHVVRGLDMLQATGQQSHLGGAVDACAAIGAEPVPIMHAFAQPSGTVERETYEQFKTEILDGLANTACDACVLLLHGAGVAEGILDMEGDLVQAVRRVVGEHMPVAASFDLHGNVTQSMADGLNGMFACHQYPHIDMHERAGEAVRLVRDLAQTGRRSRCSTVTAPMLLPTTTTFEGVGEQMLAAVLAAERATDVIDISWFHGFPYTDVPHVGSSISVTTFGDDGPDIAAELAEQLWSRREQFTPTSLNAEEAVAAARAAAAEHPNEPVVIHETSDNCGGGAPGDGTHLLRAMLDARLGAQACFGFIVDPAVAAQAQTAGVGSEIEVRLGGRYDTLHGAPIEARAYVKAVSDGRLVMQHMFKGAPLHLGTLVRLVIDDIDVIVGSRRSQTFDTEPFLAVGVDVTRYRFVALKSSNHFRAGFQHLAAAIVTADPPGLTTHHIEVFPRQTTTRRLWPLDDRARLDA